MKYSAETLKGMAEIVIEDHKSGGHASLMLFVAVANTLGMSANAVMDRIKELAT